MKNALLICLALMTSNLFANDLTIECGDVQKMYVEMDLSHEFKELYLNDHNLSVLKQNGLKHFYAGRNCIKSASRSTEEYEVLFVSHTHNLLVNDALGPFGIVGATINLSGVDQDSLQKGIVLKNMFSDIYNDESGKISATFKSKRSAKGPKLLIIRAIK